MAARSSTARSARGNTARNNTARGGKISKLTDEDVAALREQLTAGKRPRVQLSGPQFPDDATGTVVRIGDPETAGTDYVTVRVKVNGVTDELAFAPAELALPGKSARVSKHSASRTVGRTLRATGPDRTLAADQVEPVDQNPVGQPAQDTREPQPEHPAAAEAADNDPVVEPAAPAAPAMTAGPGKTTAPTRTAARGKAAIPSKPAAPTKTAAPSTTARARTAAPTEAAAKRDQPGSATKRKAATGRPHPLNDSASSRSGRRKPPSLPKVSFSVSSTGASWSVTASRGAKTVAKAVPVPPGVVTEIADLLGQPGLIEAVADINETAWAQAQERADQLRAELEELESVLAAHRSPG